MTGLSTNYSDFVNRRPLVIGTATATGSRQGDRGNEQTVAIEEAPGDLPELMPVQHRSLQYGRQQGG
jgi:hypothetical protein